MQFFVDKQIMLRDVTEAGGLTYADGVVFRCLRGRVSRLPTAGLPGRQAALSIAGVAGAASGFLPLLDHDS
jgi:hypothetical protein